MTPARQRVVRMWAPVAPERVRRGDLLGAAVVVWLALGPLTSWAFAPWGALTFLAWWHVTEMAEWLGWLSYRVEDR